ncbi:MAG TPA: hypothetical protein VGP68_09965 [Gemmataceae bacterium]|nr:hypothetical protein [Gemmataceae bacterium]
MLKFGVIAEGPSDQQVIENILLGYFQDEPEEPVVNPIQPPVPTSNLPAPPGGWTLVFRSLKQGDHQKTLQFNDYIVIQIDTDVQEEPGFDVPKRDGGVELPLEELVRRVISRLKEEMGAAFCQTDGHRILFAVAVDTIECWLLPLLYTNKKTGKTTGCLEAANAALRKAGRKGLSAGDTKFPSAYDQCSRDYTKRKKLMELRYKNPSLELFIKQLDELRKD